MEHGCGVVGLRLNRQRRPLSRDGQPRCTCGEPSVWLVLLPRKRYPAAVPPLVGGFGRLSEEGGVLSRLVRQILYLFQTEFFAVVQRHGPRQGQHHHQQGTSTASAPLQVWLPIGALRSKPRHVTWFIMVRQHPRRRRIRGCGEGQCFLNRTSQAVHRPLGFEERELERQMKAVVPKVLHQSLGGLDVNFANERSLRLVFVRDGSPAAVDLVNARLVPSFNERVVRVRGGGVTFGFDGAMGHVNSKAVNTTVKPEPQDVLHVRPHIGVVPVQFRLAWVEHMEVPRARRPVALDDACPCRSSENALPVVGR